jgi:hypothetical protein
MILAARPGFSISPLVAVWLVAVFVQARRRATFLAGQNREPQRQAEQAAADERVRIAGSYTTSSPTISV